MAGLSFISIYVSRIISSYGNIPLSAGGRTSKTPFFSHVTVRSDKLVVPLNTGGSKCAKEIMDPSHALNVGNVLLTRRGHHIKGSLILSRFHLVFSCEEEKATDKPREIWICYPMIERLSRARGTSGALSPLLIERKQDSPNEMTLSGFDRYSASHIRIICKDFTYYSFDFSNDTKCAQVYQRLSHFISLPKLNESITDFYAFEYRPNVFEADRANAGWHIYNPEEEYKRQTLITPDGSNSFWRLTKLNEKYRFCSSYPDLFVVPSSVSDSVIQHAGKFRSKQRVPAVVYKHGQCENGNVIARCSQPLVGLNLQNRSLQDEKLIEGIFQTQRSEKDSLIRIKPELREQPQRNLIVDLRPVTNALAQHALGAGTENIDNYRGKSSSESVKLVSSKGSIHASQTVDKIFCNIDNIHVMRDSLNKLTKILDDLDQRPFVSKMDDMRTPSSVQHLLTKTQWLHHLSLILQAVDRIIKSVHLNNTNVLIHCSDGWDRTSQVSALAQLCLDPYFRTIEGFMVLIEKEWLSFGFKFATRNDQGGCIGAALHKQSKASSQSSTERGSADAQTTELNHCSTKEENSAPYGSGNPHHINTDNGGAKKILASFFQKAASHIKHTASTAKAGISSEISIDESGSVYKGSNERSPVFHQFLDCVYQIHRQHPSMFEFNSRFLKRLLYHSYSCQYGNFLCDSERERKSNEGLEKQTTSVWAHFLSRRSEFTNPTYDRVKNIDALFFNYSEVKWWYELYGRSDEEMNGLSNSVEKKFAELNMGANGRLNEIRLPQFDPSRDHAFSEELSRKHQLTQD
ncbi:hypothetical protein OXX80_011405 [Metschnikowia pulcherrima]